MTTEEAMDISIEVNGDDVMIWFRWNYVKYARAAYVSRADGDASLGLSAAAARELHRKLGAALDKQDWADAGHPDEEQLMAEAEARGDPAREPSDAVLRSGPGNVDEIITSHVSAHVKTEHRGSGA